MTPSGYAFVVKAGEEVVEFAASNPRPRTRSSPPASDSPRTGVPRRLVAGSGDVFLRAENDGDAMSRQRGTRRGGNEILPLPGGFPNTGRGRRSPGGE